jgi:two-component system chemotaxis sensor kinase CheA
VVTQPADASGRAAAAESRVPEGPAETIRVGMTLLDKLMMLVGELVLARNQLRQFSNTAQNIEA